VPAHRTPARSLGLLASLLGLLLAATACGSDDTDTVGGTDGSGGSADPVVIEVTVADGDVDPKGDRIQVGTGQEIVLDVTADTSGTLHVHANPEESFDFEEGEQEFTLTIDQPGVVEVETHDPDLIVAQLQVS